MTRCNQLADLIVTGEPMSDDDRAHLASCADCAALATTARGVAATAVAAEPGPGFAARLAARARERLASRRRQRYLGFSAAVVAAAGMTFLVIQRRDDRRPAVALTQPPLSGGADRDPGLPENAEVGGITDDELRELVRGGTLSEALAPAVDWNEIAAPVANYRAVLVRGGQP